LKTTINEPAGSVLVFRVRSVVVGFNVDLNQNFVRLLEALIASGQAQLSWCAEEVLFRKIRGHPDF
jgi:hypothetical protein